MANLTFAQPQQHQLDMYQEFVPTKCVCASDMSNAIDFWDSVPKYFVSRAAQSKLRSSEGRLPSVTREFHCHGEKWSVTIGPARILERNKEIDYLPGKVEEIVEDALRKLSTMSGVGFVTGNQFGVRFTLYGLRKELSTQGHTYSYAQLDVALQVLKKASLDITAPLQHNKQQHTKSINILTQLDRISRANKHGDPKSCYQAIFSHHVSDAIRDLSYRQIDYNTVMAYNGQLSRYLHKRLARNYVQASPLNPYTISMNSIARDSGLLEISRAHDRLRKVQQALDELVESDVLSGYDTDIERGSVQGSRNAIIDAKCTLRPTVAFIRMATAANHRSKTHRGGSLATSVVAEV